MSFSEWFYLYFLIFMILTAYARFCTKTSFGTLDRIHPPESFHGRTL